MKRLFYFAPLVIFFTTLPLGASSSTQPSMHPRFALLDDKGNAVETTGQPLSTMRTCGVCHDTGYITSHFYHAKAMAEMRAGAEMNCFVCHISSPDNDARMSEIRANRPKWAATATLASTGVVQKHVDKWTWKASAFASDGLISEDFPRLRPPTSANCGICHGQVHSGSSPVVYKTGRGQSFTASTGAIYSGQRLRDSGMNLAGKDGLSRSWDIHAERLLECTSCHYSVNNPAYEAGADRAKPGSLRFESRRMSVGEYVRKPSHDFASAGKMRHCDSCHDATSSHQWLPYTNRHMAALSCEACHIPKVYAPARQQIDRTVVDLEGNPITSYRGVDGDVNNPASLIDGFRPVLLSRKQPDGSLKLTPHNLVATWEWVSGDNAKPVSAQDLKKAFLDGAHYRPEILSVLDTNHDGKLDQGELRLDMPQKTAVVQKRLEVIGLKSPRIVGRIQPRALHHGVAGGEWATRSCADCHSGGAATHQQTQLAAFVPGNVTPTLADLSDVQLNGTLAIGKAGDLTYEPAANSGGRYIIGRDHWRFGDTIGVIAVIAVVFGVGIHGTVRIVSARKRVRT